jgi:hypothetical protein
MCLTIVNRTTTWFIIIQLPTITRLTVHDMDNGRKATCREDVVAKQLLMVKLSKLIKVGSCCYATTIIGAWH